MARKLGGNRAGSGKVASNPGLDKWVDSIANHSSSASKVKDVMVKTIPVDYIVTDENNPRKLHVDSKLIKKIIQTHPLKDQATSNTDSEWIEPYVKEVVEAYSLQGKEIGDLTSLVEFAFSLQSAEKMLHPVVVWKEESTFHLMVGERRYLSHLLLQETHIYSRIHLERPSQFELDLLQWKENMDREEMSLYDRLTRIQKLIEDVGGRSAITVVQLAAIIGKSRTVAHRYIYVLEAKSDLLMPYIKEGRVTELKKAAELAKLTDSELNARLGIGQKKVDKKSSGPAPIKINKGADTKAIEKLVRAAAESLDIGDLLESADFSNPKNAGEILNTILSKLSEAK
ncbi:ParB/RepB/Spo0J family partition protein [Alteromonas gilva]|uniref:ParB/Sulfiredoxin domain-containing protein n=1 Tax=Alteromonas gilva TaxID=2987522 RepID=A0ABT5L7F2_9ALTE|nr:hypothetical protein [Alteromonas gilva]MDC8832992.1 hypothetical protein [Alteromonas gilva]